MSNLQKYIKNLINDYNLSDSNALQEELSIIIEAVLKSANDTNSKQFLDFLRLSQFKSASLTQNSLPLSSTKPIEASNGKTLFVYTDGACSGNPGAGGYGCVITGLDKEIELSGGDKLTTNNKMELLAPIKALAYIIENVADYRTYQIVLTTDSQYVKNGISTWINSWKNKGWKTASGDAVKNRELWEELDLLNSKLHVKWLWVKGHAGHHYNEICDKLACIERDKFKN